MNTSKNDDINLAKWLSGELTPEEQHAFEQSDAYQTYVKIITATDRLSDPDYNVEESLNKVKQTLASRPKVRKLNTRFIYAVAASLVILFGLYFLMRTTSVSFQTGYGEQLAIVLPNGSEVTLNSNTTLHFNKRDWNENRILNLDGEAYFNVTKGVPFKVITNEGTVEVLGTQFNVTTNANYLEVSCYSGKVKVTNVEKSESFLTKGKAHRTYDKVVTTWDFDPSHLFWLKGRHTFTNTPLLEVINALEDQYQIEIQNTSIFKNEKFTGHFINDNLDIALKTVFGAMNIDYKQANNTITLSKQ